MSFENQTGHMLKPKGRTVEGQILSCESERLIDRKSLYFNLQLQNIRISLIEYMNINSFKKAETQNYKPTVVSDHLKLKKIKNYENQETTFRLQTLRPKHVSS